MKAIVVYESHWGNTAAIAHAIAEGIGSGAQALATDAATAEVVAGADLIIAGSPMIAFSLPTEASLKSMESSASRQKVPPDLSHPSMRSWLDALPKGSARVAAFETRIRWSPGSASPEILRKLEAKGYRPVAKVQKFIVQGGQGPLRDGELERAKAWGAQLAETAGT